ncbi:hypothetical protein [Microbacterium sp. Ag1]|uniref:hypothetical protein n=1 Tax=Microbacterium sp. Ag1 TaxID=1643443 RepID=UPI0006296515|nr:hypothetical protein [Microbacterium sp. Ag1]KKX97752.1 hypothetical protein AAY78_11220 [Microbacterium sp. Ag1]
MLIGLIRPVEKHSITLEGEDIADIRAPTMKTGESVRSVEGKFERRDGQREIEAEDMAALEAQVPEDWQMLYVRTD